MTRVFVVEVSPTVADDGSTATYLFSTHAFATRPTDTPPNTPVRALLRNAGTVRRELFSGARVTGAITPSYGNIVLANPAPVDGAEGELDDWLAYGISGSRVIVRWGNLGDAYPSAWTTVYIAYAHSMIVDTAAITIRLRDRLQLLDKPVVNEAFAGTGGVEGTGNVSKKKQFVSSDPGLIEPVLIDANKLIYFVQSTGDGGFRDNWQVNPAPKVRPFDVFDQGVRLTRTTANYASEAELLASYPASGEVKFWFGPASAFIPAWTNGPVYFRLGSPPAGDLRCFPLGYPSDLDHTLAGGAVGSFTAGQMALRAGVDAASIGADVLQASSQLVNDGATFLDLLADCALAFNGWFGFSRLDEFRSGYLLDPESTSFSYGMLVGGPFAPSPSTSVYTFTGGAVNSLRREPPAGMEAPVWSASFEVGQTWPSELAGGADPELRDYLTRDPAWTAFQGVSTSTLLANPGAITASVQVRGRYVQNNTDALRMAQRYLALYGGRRDFWTFSVPMADDVLALDLHDCVTLQTPRFGLAAGRKHRIVGITLDCASAVSQIRYTLWGGEAGVWTGGSGGPGTVGWGGGGSGGGTSAAPLLLRNSLGDFTGYMFGSVSTASATGGGGAGAPGATGGGALGDFTGYMVGILDTPSDPLRAYVISLVLGEGADGGTTFDDDIAGNADAGRTGSVTTSTASPPFGASSVNFPGSVGNSSIIVYPAATWLEAGGSTLYDSSGCIDVWIKPTSVATRTQCLFGDDYVSGSTAWNCYLNVFTDGQLGLTTRGGSISSATGVVTDGTWQHIAMTWDNGALKLWHQGVNVASGAISTYTAQNAGNWLFGEQNKYFSGYERNFIGPMKCMRITFGHIRYPGTASFTPPASLAEYAAP